MDKFSLKLIFLGLWLTIFLTGGAMSARAAEDMVVVGPEGYGELREAIEEVNEGGTIVIQAGQYPVPLLVINKSITICGEAGVILTAAEDTTNLGTTTSWIRVEPGSKVTFENLHLDGSGKNINYALYGGDTVEVKNCSFANIKYVLNDRGSAIVLRGDSSLVEGCSFNAIGQSGIYLFACKNVRLENNTYTGKGDKGGGPWLEYGIEVANGTQVTLCGNTITRCTGLSETSGALSAGILINTSDPSCPCHVIIENKNVIQDNLDGIQIGTRDIENSKVEIRGNIITGNIGSALYSYSHEVSAEGNYWGTTGPVLQGPNKVPAWLDTCPWAADTADENGDGRFDHQIYPLTLQWSEGGNELLIRSLEPGACCDLSFVAQLNERAQETTVTYVLEWTAADTGNLAGVTVNGATLQQNRAVISDTLQPGQANTCQVEVVITTPGTYNVVLWGQL